MVATAPAAAAPTTATRAALLLALAAGGAGACQSRLNGQLNEVVGSALLAAVVSFGIGLVLVLGLVLARPSARAGWAQVRTVPVWRRLGGLGGATLIAVSAAAAPVLGVALLSVGLVAGQTGGGVLVDRIGLGPGGRRPLTGPRLVGAVLCLLAVTLSVAGKGARDAAPLLLLLVVLAGLATTLQQALNGHVRAATGDASVATLLNFLVGISALLVGLVGHALLTGAEFGPLPGAGQWYLYLGGPIGVAYVIIAASTVRVLGVLRLTLTTIAGQLVGAVLLDLLVPPAGTTLSPFTVVGALLTLVAVTVSGRPSR